MPKSRLVALRASETSLSKDAQFSSVKSLTPEQVVWSDLPFRSLAAMAAISGPVAFVRSCNLNGPSVLNSRGCPPRCFFAKGRTRELKAANRDAMIRADVRSTPEAALVRRFHLRCCSSSGDNAWHLASCLRLDPGVQLTWITVMAT